MQEAADRLESEGGVPADLDHELCLLEQSRSLLQQTLVVLMEQLDLSDDALAVKTEAWRLAIANARGECRDDVELPRTILQQLEADKADLEQQLADCRAALAATRADLAACEAELADTRDDLQAMTEERDALIVERDGLLADLADCRAQVEELRDELAQREAELAACRDQAEQDAATIAALEADVQRLSAELGACQSERDSLQQQLTACQQELVAAHNRIATLTSQVNRLSADVSHLDRSLQSFLPGSSYYGGWGGNEFLFHWTGGRLTRIELWDDGGGTNWVEGIRCTWLDARGRLKRVTRGTPSGRQYRALSLRSGEYLTEMELGYRNSAPAFVYRMRVRTNHGRSIGVGYIPVFGGWGVSWYRFRARADAAIVGFEGRSGSGIDRIRALHATR